MLSVRAPNEHLITDLFEPSDQPHPDSVRAGLSRARSFGRGPHVPDSSSHPDRSNRRAAALLFDEDLLLRRVLTPADFALVRRRAAVIGTAEPDGLVRLLEAECEGRSGGRRPHGLHSRRGVIAMLRRQACAALIALGYIMRPILPQD